MSSIVEGFSCPICHLVIEDEACEAHPDLYVDLVLTTSYFCGTNGNRPIDIFQWTDEKSPAELFCSMPSASDLDEERAQRICNTLSACREISSQSLSAGYIQTLQQLPLLIQDHLANPSPETEQRLKQQLCVLDARNRPDDEDDGNDQDDDYN